MHSKSSFRIVLTHCVAWAAFIFYEVSIALVLNPARALWWEHAGYYLVNISLFYLHAHVALAYALKKRKLPLLLTLLVPLELALYTLVEYGLENLLNLIRTNPKLIVVDSFFVFKYIWRGCTSLVSAPLIGSSSTRSPATSASTSYKCSG